MRAVWAGREEWNGGAWWQWGSTWAGEGAGLLDPLEGQLLLADGGQVPEQQQVPVQQHLPVGAGCSGAGRQLLQKESAGHGGEGASPRHPPGQGG